MAESQVLEEVVEEIHQTKLHQEVENFLDLGVLGLPYVNIKVFHQYGLLLPEAEQGLLQV